VTTILPNIGVEANWIGRQCLTADGRYIVVTVAPSLASSHPDLVAHGGFAYSLDVASGAARPLLSGVTLAYFSPGCGAADSVALTSFRSADDAPTSVQVFDASTGLLTATMSAQDEITSAIPISPTTVIGVGSSGLVEMTPIAALAIAALPGEGFELHANRAGGVDFLIGDIESQVAFVAGWTPTAGLQSFGSGPLAATSLWAGRNGSSAVVGAQPGLVPVLPGVPAVPSPTDLTWLTAPATTTVEYVSSNADAELVALAGNAGLAVDPGNGQLLPVTLPNPPANSVTNATSTMMAAAVADNVPTSPANTTQPTCAVARNDVHRQVVQPGTAQIDWAVQEATRGALTHSRYGDPSWGLQSYTPSTSFPPSLTVPREVMSGIMAAESNWDQASLHATRGVAGNPLIANYYGLAANGTSRDYNNADCGYGLTQQTDGMRTTDTLFTSNTQQAIGLDYAENIAVGTWTLVNKWNQLKSLGIVANDGNPAYLENWYFAIWAYNTGIHTNDPSGQSGLGWANNPANPAYPPNRVPFLSDSYADASHPSDWPYQEQVIGWMEYPLLQGGSTAYRPAYQNLLLPPHNLFCTIPQDSCSRGDSSYGSGVTYSANGVTDPAKSWTSGEWVGTTVSVGAPSSPGYSTQQITSSGVHTLTVSQNWGVQPASGTAYVINPFCTRSDYKCWWHYAARWGNGCQSGCTTSQWSLSTTAAEPPTPANPFAPVCNVAARGAPVPSAVIVDDEADGKPNDLHVSLNSHCTGTRNWQNNGTFSLTFGSLAVVDFHQLGAGFDGHMWFSHEVAASDTIDRVTGTWKPTLTQTGNYMVWVFDPAAGAGAVDARYTVQDGSGHTYRSAAVRQGWAGNAWLQVGVYHLTAGASVSLSNNTSASLNDLGFDAMAFEPIGLPLLLIHGAQMSSGASGGNDGAAWDTFKTFFKQRGFYPQSEGYYYNDVNMDDYIDYSGNGAACYGSSYYQGAHGDGEQAASSGRPSHNSNADYRHLAYQLAWRIHDLYGTQPIAIDADSAGGLIVQWMLYQYNNAETQCPYPSLHIYAVTTTATPHAGDPAAAAGCPTFFEDCELEDNTSSEPERNAFLYTLDNTRSGLDPQATGGTTWTLLASTGDNVISPSSALFMGQVAGIYRFEYYDVPGCPQVNNWCATANGYVTYNHGGYWNDPSTATDAGWIYGYTNQQTNEPHGLLLLYYALASVAGY
jgi:hypothetical protein